MPVTEQLPLGVVKKPYGPDGNRYIFPESYLLLVEPAPKGETAALKVTAWKRNPEDLEIFKKPEFNDFKKRRDNALIVDRADIPKLLNILKQLDDSCKV